MNILYFVFGENLENHIQTHLSIRTTMLKKQEDDCILICTDHPEFYLVLKNRVKIFAVSDDDIKNWIGNSGYKFRSKIKAIEKIASLYPHENLLFLDGDTFVKGPISEIDKMMTQGYGFMHIDEGHPLSMKRGSLRMWRALKNDTFYNIKLSNKHDIWNSGVIGIPSDKLSVVIPLALNICDYILDKKIDCFTAEQYAFSIAMYECTQLRAAKKYISHYWGNKKEWIDVASKLFLKSYFCESQMSEEFLAIQQQNFLNYPIYIRHSNTLRRLYSILKKVFPDKNIKYDY